MPVWPVPRSHLPMYCLYQDLLSFELFSCWPLAVWPMSHRSLCWVMKVLAAVTFCWYGEWGSLLLGVVMFLC